MTIYRDHKINPTYKKMTKRALLELWSKTIDRPFCDRYLLSESVKVLKGEALGYLTGVLYMSAATVAYGVPTCSHHILADCGDKCLVKSGHMADLKAVQARRDRLELFLKDPALFFEILSREVKALKRRASSQGLKKAGRLNGTTDLDFTRITFNGLTIFEHLKGLRWYDYTKNPNLAANYRAAGVPVTFSWYKKADTKKVIDLLDAGGTIAIAYSGSDLPADQKIGDRSFRVIDGDISDLRFLDPKSVVVGLRFKKATFSSEAKRINSTALQSGFIIQPNTAIL